MRTGVPCNENKFFPVRISTQGKPCSGPVLTLYGIAVQIAIIPTFASIKKASDKHIEKMRIDSLVSMRA